MYSFTFFCVLRTALAAGGGGGGQQVCFWLPFGTALCSMDTVGTLPGTGSVWRTGACRTARRLLEYRGRITKRRGNYTREAVIMATLLALSLRAGLP